MIRHTVSFRFNPGLTEKERAAFFAAVQKLAKIPGIREFQLFRQVNAKSIYTHGLMMDFDNQSHFILYNDHPEHVKFVDRFWKSAVADFIEMDYLQV